MNSIHHSIFRFLLSGFIILSGLLQAQTPIFTHDDTLRGSITKERKWWDVLQYEITVEPDFSKETLSGTVFILFKVTESQKFMQIDLQQPLLVDSIWLGNKVFQYKHNKDVILVQFTHLLAPGIYKLGVSYHGKPKAAKNPPWDGGWIWQSFEGSPWVSVACQHTGASCWYPCKDHLYDEPDSGVVVQIITPDSLTAVSNGIRVAENKLSGHKKSVSWKCSEPINTYNVAIYIGNYKTDTMTFKGLSGPLPCSFWYLKGHEAEARRQFQQVPGMLTCFEHWFGPYPFYRDGYKLVEAPFLGMEHQSGIAYGNGFQNGYMGKDLSGTGVGLRWDFIIIHESGHEWWGNNISVKDIADMWVHEAFTSYAETIYSECLLGRDSAFAYVAGTRKKITNTSRITGYYDVNHSGSPDMYYKGANMIHMIRLIMDDDLKFRNMLKALQIQYYHQTVTADQVENFIMDFSGYDFSKLFEQYLHTKFIPVLRCRHTANGVQMRWTHCVSGFNMKIKLKNGKWIQPTENWQVFEQISPDPKLQTPDNNFYVEFEKE